MRIEPLGPDAEVLGGAINGFIDAANREDLMPHLERLDMVEIQPDKWYPKQKYIDLWNAILEAGAIQNFVSIGITIAEIAWPPDSDQKTFDELIEDWGNTFDLVNRGEDRGYVYAEKRRDKEYAVLCRTPDPDDLNYGVVYGFCRRFLPSDTDFTVKYDPEVTRRDEGGEETVILIVLD